MMCSTPYKVGNGLRLVVVQVGASVGGRSTEELGGGMPQPRKRPAHAHDMRLACWHSVVGQEQLSQSPAD